MARRQGRAALGWSGGTASLSAARVARREVIADIPQCDRCVRFTFESEVCSPRTSAGALSQYTRCFFVRNAHRNAKSRIYFFVLNVTGELLDHYVDQTSSDPRLCVCVSTHSVVAHHQDHITIRP